MDFRFSEEQDLLRDMLARYLSDHYTFDARQAAVNSAIGWRPDCWRAFAQDLGLLGIGIPERFGGSGGGIVDYLVVMEQFGRHLVLEPYLGTAILAVEALQHADETMAADVLPAIAAGERVVGWAHAEPELRYGMAPRVRAEADAGGYRLHGRKALVSGAPWATHFIVSANTAEGPTLFWVERTAPGLTLIESPTFDGGRTADLVLAGVRVSAAQVLGTPGGALPLLERLCDIATLALCAEATGATARMLEDTVAYARQRQQFGQAIGSFQALQHRMADMYMLHEQAVALTQVAAMRVSDEHRERALAVSTAKAHVDEAGRRIGQGAVQIHGGMGVTEETAVGHYFKRVTAIGLQFGNIAYHLRRCVDLRYPANV
nr:acyl-CoA dehydrogenase family protein [uncultured Pseudomonas sp.]